MNAKTLGRLLVLSLGAAAAALLISRPSTSQTTPVSLAPPISATSETDYNSVPVTSVETAPPIVMLTLSRDHQLHYKAYNDYSDLDDNDVLETTYNHAIDYYGYFDSYKCYTYSSANGRFEPSTINTTKYCSGAWSGNFLNWVATTRMDAVRKLLYGGLRRIDDDTATVLERSHLPSDAHAFAKYYNGGDIAQLTPFTDIATAAPQASSTSNVALAVGARSFVVANNSLGQIAPGDQIRAVNTANVERFMFGYVTSTSVSGSNLTVNVQVYSTGTTNVGSSYNSWTVTNLTRSGISFCNVTYSNTSATPVSDDLSHTTTRPPLLRVARGNYSLWNANEVRQCYWHEEVGSPTAINATGANNSQAAQFGLYSSVFGPTKTVHALGSGSAAGASNTANGEFIVRVSACVAGLEGRERCKQYPTVGSVRKPIGLLQVYGDDNRISFGLVTPSYTRNISGGVVRKNVGSMATEINVTTNGTFTGSTGVISTLNALRMYGYDYSEAQYNNADACTFRLLGLVQSGGSNTAGQNQNQGNCSTWGNPIGEAYVEALRMLAGKTANSAFTYTSAGSKDAAIGLSLVTPTDPISNANYCSNLNVLAFNASVSSYDDDQMAGLSDLGATRTAAQITKSIGDLEGITNGSWFVGTAPGASSGTQNSCIAKTITDLGAVSGLCPEAPRLQGTYNVAGAAFYAKTNRIRSDLTAVPSNDTTSLKVTTYGISLATNTPQIVIPVPGETSKKVTIIPALRTDLTGGGTSYGPGAIVDFRIVAQDLAAGTGTFYVSWENSTQGADYDQDMWGIIRYAINSFTNPKTIAVTTEAVSLSAGTSIGFGYIINGTTQDGLHFHSGGSAGSAAMTYTDPNNITVTPTTNLNASGGCNGCQVTDLPSTATYRIGTTAAGLLKDPLYYAAKYGGFDDSDGDNTPDLLSEWDSKNANGQPVTGGDGLPDTYFFVSNPNALENSLRTALDAILAKTASGTAAAVVSNAREGEGAVYQALFESTRTDASGRKVNWIGTVQSLWIDKLGRLREDDGDQIFQESDYTRDPVVEAFYDPSDRTTKLRRYSGNPAVSTASTVVPLSSLKSLWNARKQLSSVSNVTSQRSFSSPANTGRHLLTFVDNNQNRTIDSGEIVDFMPASFTSNKYGLLNAQTSADATNIVNYIRGQEISGLRSRSVDYDGDGTPDVQRLGDVVSSTPTAVGAPSEGYSTLYGDETYSAFVKQYRDRRTVVYVGGNDGVIHAFNGGFYDPTAKRFRTQRTSADAAHPLGSEIWGYVPYNLLPHLRWLTNNNYGHVYYIDGKPRVFDARIFTPDATHPYGWGTVMVIGMRFGGGSLQMNTKTGTTVNPPFSGLSNVPNPMVMRSAYILMDITNPEVAPTVIAEINDAGSTTPKLGLTTGLPTAFTFSQRANSTSGTYTSENWYLTFGTGPDSLSQVNSATNEAGLYVYDLRARSFVSGYAPLSLGTNATTGAPTSFLGDPVSVDWDLDFKADALYFGTVGGTAASPSGKLFKLALNESAAPSGWSAPQVLTDPGAPVTSTPSVALDENNNRWVYAGTGRYYINNDKASTPQQYLFGVIDRVNASASPAETLPVSFANLIDTTAAKVRTTGAVEGVTATPAVTSEAGLASATASKRGWKLRLNYPGSTPAEREVTRTSLLGEVLFATTFTPSNTLCTGEGSSRLFALYFKTGAGRSNLPALGTIGDNGIDNDGDGDGDSGTGGDDADDNVVITNLSLGGGQASNPALHLGGSVAAPAGGGGDTDPNSGGSLGAAGCGTARTEVTALSQTSVAALENRKIAIVPGACSGEIDWRDSRRSIGN